jgi:hypothetical protein
MSDELTLRIQREDEIVLPSAILDGALTLPELGALILLAAIAEGQVGFDLNKAMPADQG